MSKSKGENSPVPSSFLQEKTNLTLRKLGTHELQVKYARAIQMSLQIDVDNLEKPTVSNIEDIETEYGFNLTVQRDYFIAMNKQTAKVFLENLGFPIRKSFDNTYNRIKYKEIFGKEPCIVGTRQMILSYAEWLHLVNYPFQPELPAAIQNLV